VLKRSVDGDLLCDLMQIRFPYGITTQCINAFTQDRLGLSAALLPRAGYKNQRAVAVLQCAAIVADDVADTGNEEVDRGQLDPPLFSPERQPAILQTVGGGVRSTA
jgi:hypothetical protein